MTQSGGAATVMVRVTMGMPSDTRYRADKSSDGTVCVKCHEYAGGRFPVASSG